MKRRAFLAGAAAGTVALAAPAIVRAQDVDDPARASDAAGAGDDPRKAIEPWAKRVEEPRAAA